MGFVKTSLNKMTDTEFETIVGKNCPMLLRWGNLGPYSFHDFQLFQHGDEYIGEVLVLIPADLREYLKFIYSPRTFDDPKVTLLDYFGNVQRVFHLKNFKEVTYKFHNHSLDKSLSKWSGLVVKVLFCCQTIEDE